MPEQLLEEDFDPKRHDRDAFDGGVASLNEFLKRLATQHRKRNLAAIRVLVDSRSASAILGYYTLSAASVHPESLGGTALPRHSIPCFLLGRLAVDQGCRGRGFGGILLAKAVERCVNANRVVAAHAVIVDAKDDPAANFYLHYGFEQCKDSPRRLFLPLGKPLG